MYSKDNVGGSVLVTAWDVSSGARKATLLIQPDKEGIAKPMRQFTDIILEAVQTMTGTRVGDQNSMSRTRAGSPELRKSLNKTMIAVAQIMTGTKAETQS